MRGTDVISSLLTSESEKKYAPNGKLIGKNTIRFMKENRFTESDISAKKNVVVFMHGLPGSGKTTMVNNWIELQVRVLDLSKKKHFKIISADDYFKNSEGAFAFDPFRLQESHDWCLRVFEKCIGLRDKYVQQQDDTCEFETTEDNSELQFIIVDNCNLQKKHVDPYVNAIKKNEWQMVIYVFRTNYRLEMESHKLS